MQIQHYSQQEFAAESIEAAGGELLAGSGFETEEPEPGFAGTELDGEG